MGERRTNHSRAWERAGPFAAAGHSPRRGERRSVARRLAPADDGGGDLSAAGAPTVKSTDGHDDALEEFVLSAGATNVPIETRFIRAATGLAASDFMRSVEADLLVVPLPKSQGIVQQLPSNIAWVSDVIPCNLWVIR